MQLKRHFGWSFPLCARMRCLIFPALVIVAGPAFGGDALQSESSAGGPALAQRNSSAPAVATVEVRLEDESILKLVVKDDRLEMMTRYGRVTIPVGEIEKIDFGHRIAQDVAVSVSSHIAALGSKDFQSREAASQALLRLREKSYAELVKAAKSKDAEVVRRAEQLLQKIREQVPEDRLSPPEFDVVQTSDGSRLVGRIEVPAFRVRTIAFGDQHLKLSDVRSLRSLSYEEPEQVVTDALPDPGNMTAFQGQVGKTLAIKVTGRAGGAAPQVAPGGAVVLVAGGTVWGTEIYTLDSTVSLAAVHAGLLKAGQSAILRVKILGPQTAFQGSERNGIQSMAYGFYNGGYSFEKKAHRSSRATVGIVGTPGRNAP